MVKERQSTNRGNRHQKRYTKKPPLSCHIEVNKPGYKRPCMRNPSVVCKALREYELPQYRDQRGIPLINHPVKE